MPDLDVNKIHFAHYTMEKQKDIHKNHMSKQQSMEKNPKEEVSDEVTFF